MVEQAKAGEAAFAVNQSCFGNEIEPGKLRLIGSCEVPVSQADMRVIGEIWWFVLATTVSNLR